MTLHRRSEGFALENDFNALDPETQQFHLHLKRRPVKISIHLCCLLNVAHIYKIAEVRATIAQALKLATYNAAYVKKVLLVEHRRL
jgi:hypothetical protein